MKLYGYLALCCVAVSTALAADCNTMCTQEIRPVCASNGQTYNNKCVFENAKCKADDATLTIVKEGECTGSGGGGGGGGGGVSKCPQEFACLDVNKPVCGSDGVTYSNDCQLKKAACVDKTITKKSDGACDATKPTTPTSSPSTTTKPSSGSSSGQSDDVCAKACTKEISYVCGSDNVTYSNPCLLEQEKRCKSPMLTKASDGECATKATSSPSNANTAPTSAPTTQPKSGSNDPSPLWTVGISAVIGMGIAAVL